MTRLAAILTTVMLATLSLPAPTPAADTAKQPADKQNTPSSAASGARVETDAAKKPEQGTVQSRGLFAKKKKKQVGVGGGASAGHSQEPDQADQSSRNDLGVGK